MTHFATSTPSNPSNLERSQRWPNSSEPKPNKNGVWRQKITQKLKNEATHYQSSAASDRKFMVQPCRPTKLHPHESANQRVEPLLIGTSVWPRMIPRRRTAARDDPTRHRIRPWPPRSKRGQTTTTDTKRDNHQGLPTTTARNKWWNGASASHRQAPTLRRPTAKHRHKHGSIRQCAQQRERHESGINDHRELTFTEIKLNFEKGTY